MTVKETLEAEIAKLQAELAALPSEVHSLEMEVWQKIKTFIWSSHPVAPESQPPVPPA